VATLIAAAREDIVACICYSTCGRQVSKHGGRHLVRTHCNYGRNGPLLEQCSRDTLIAMLLQVARVTNEQSHLTRGT
jgi:hypothetical protein